MHKACEILGENSEKIMYLPLKNSTFSHHYHSRVKNSNSKTVFSSFGEFTEGSLKGRVI